ncbi:hypothetical protein CLTEP_07040 [Clostridium tepidiprofundi DSM 19306]|uniref:HTH-like domain-containing protein n=1 Tax=Clostridium tepidiprofundi DSM 19306 TaxID=1121338 RepID=A0A151B696_9CLOT|nr:IS3 family transposase [Clostridium tepidiprofundi]KYH35300.1 hypothetical protein CLTEP_07040 [Clostridium tepidiprofundi DSM 19306]
MPGYSYDVEGEAIAYGYIKLKHHIKREHGVIVNHKKMHRLCKELDILRLQREIKEKTKKHIAVNRTITGSNQLWEMDLKYGYIHGKDIFFM